MRVDQPVAEPVRLPRMHAEVRVRRRDVIVVPVQRWDVGRANTAPGGSEEGGARASEVCVFAGDRAPHIPAERFANVLG